MRVAKSCHIHDLACPQHCPSPSQWLICSSKHILWPSAEEKWLAQFSHGHHYGGVQLQPITMGNKPQAHTLRCQRVLNEDSRRSLYYRICSYTDPRTLFKSNQPIHSYTGLYVLVHIFIHVSVYVYIYVSAFCPYLSLHPYHPSVSPIFGYPTYEVSASYIKSSDEMLNSRCQPNGGNEEFRQGNLSNITSFEIESGPHGNIQLLPQDMGICVYNVTVSWHLVSAVRASACATAHSHSDTLFLEMIADL